MAKRKVANRKTPLAMEGAKRVRRETFGGLPIVDAKTDFTLVVRTRDVTAAKGHEKDASNCILAKACAQQVGASVVAFFRRTAYLELPDAKGVRRVVRYRLDDDARAIVSAFDRGKSVKGEVTVTLKAPTASQSLDSLREKSRQKRAGVQKAVLSGRIYDPKMQARYHEKPAIAGVDVRSGTGRVHNAVKKAKTLEP